MAYKTTLKQREYRKKWYYEMGGKEKIHNWVKANPLEARKIDRKRRLKRRKIILNYYSGNPPKCACCSESTIEFLCIDHVGGGGNKHRKTLGVKSGSSFYGWLKRNNFPSGFRVLCNNCNQCFGSYGYCAHQNKK